MSPDPRTSNDEQRLFELLDGYVASLSENAADVPDPPEELLSAFPELADLLDCLDTLDSLAVDSRMLSQDRKGEGRDDESESDRPCDFGRYELLAEIGRGGMGVVFSARQKMLNAIVALKIIRSSQFASNDEIRRFYSEARAAAGLRHPNIVSVHDVGDWQGQHYLTMDLIDGRSLACLLAVDGPMEPKAAAELLATVARAVDYLHRHDIIHRDLKPSNIMLDERGVPYVSDFGLAKFFSADSNETLSGTIIGTPSYMAPEQASGRSKEVSPRSDVYSLGAILYEMLTGRPPFVEENPLDTLLLVLEAEPEPLRRLKSDVPVELEALCLKCLEKRPENRLESAAALTDELDRFLTNEPLRLKPRSLWDRLRRWTRREPALASRLAIVAAGTCVVEGNYRIARNVAWNEHWPVMLVIGLWAIACVICQKLANRDGSEEPMRYAWAVFDVLFLTALLILARPHAPLGPIVIGFPLLVVASGLWFEVHLVWFMTALATAGYVLVNRIRPDPVLDAEVPRHYPYIFVVVLCGIGYIVAYQVERIRTLSRHFERRR